MEAWVVEYSLLGVNTLLLLRVVFQAGAIVQRVDDLEKRMDRLPCERYSTDKCEVKAS